MRVDDNCTIQISALHKDADLIGVLTKLRDAWGDGAFDVVDHWEADLHAVGVAKKGDPALLVYIGNFGRPRGTYYVELEGPPVPGSGQPFSLNAVHDSVKSEDVLAL